MLGSLKHEAPLDSWAFGGISEKLPDIPYSEDLPKLPDVIPQFPCSYSSKFSFSKVVYISIHKTYTVAG